MTPCKFCNSDEGPRHLYLASRHWRRCPGPEMEAQRARIVELEARLEHHATLDRQVRELFDPPHPEGPYGDALRRETAREMISELNDALDAVSIACGGGRDWAEPQQVVDLVRAKVGP